MTGGPSSVSGPIPSVGRSVIYSASPQSLGKRRWLHSLAGDGGMRRGLGAWSRGKAGSRAEWQELDDSCRKRSEWCLLRTDSEGIRHAGDDRMRCVWSGRGGVGPAVVAVGRQRRREVAAAVQTELARSGLLSDRHCSDGPGPTQITAELIFQYSKYLQILKYKMKAILMLKNIQTWHGGRFEHSEQFFPLGRLPIPNIIQVTNFGINSNLNLP
jgi:hypothetical protein